MQWQLRHARGFLSAPLRDKHAQCPIFWYRRKDYKRIRSIMDDADQFPETFDEWEKTAERRLAAEAGVSIQPVMLDPGEFLAYSPWPSEGSSRTIARPGRMRSRTAEARRSRQSLRMLD